VSLNNVGLLEDMRSTEISILAGAGIEFWKVSLDLRYSQGLTSFDDSAEKLDIKNRVVSFIFGFSLCR
jgi:hypothetical protein